MCEIAWVKKTLTNMFDYEYYILFTYSCTDIIYTRQTYQEKKQINLFVFIKRTEDTQKAILCYFCKGNHYLKKYGVHEVQYYISHVIRMQWIQRTGPFFYAWVPYCSIIVNFISKISCWRPS